MARANNDFQTVHSEGGLLPPDLLRRVVDPNSKLLGTNPEDYGLPPGERFNEAITQSWNRMRRHWSEFRNSAKNLALNEPGTGLTNDKWSVPLLRELGFGLLPTSPMPTIDGRGCAINRFFGSTAIHLIGCGLSLDRRAAGVRGASATNPHGLVQDFLNRSPAHLWAIVSNGLRLRVLRDNQALSRQSYLEFDLEALFTGEVFSDFVLLWLMAHSTRFAAQTEGRPESCWLEQWTKIADEEGTRALGDLRAGVEKALQIFGEAFVSHPRNTALREALRSEKLTLSNFHAQLLRLVYRLIFLFVAEDRTLDGISLIHPRDDSEDARKARERYDTHYSTARLRDLAGKIKGSRHGDLWQQFNLLVGALSGDKRFEAGRTNLALPVLGSFLWDPESTSALNAAGLNVDDGVELANFEFLEALRHLAYTRQGKVLRPVDYKNLGAEELGGVYESLLALTPQISGDGARFTFAEFAGNERKTSGSYYTPDSLVQCLLDSALDPVVEEALKGKSGVEAEKAILALKVCDPAVGSGHFLVGAAHRLARHLSRVRANTQGESEPSPLHYQHALRDVIGRCLYGVDINPMSAELCRVSLWLEALEPGKPLSFLEHHIQVGNSLLGTTPKLMDEGIPDAAFEPIEGDDKAVCREYKKLNKDQRSGQGDMFEIFEGRPWERLGNFAASLSNLDTLPDDTPEQIEAKRRTYEEAVSSGSYLSNKLLADAWCAAFVWKKTRNNHPDGFLEPITQKTFETIAENPHKVPQATRDEIQRLAKQYQFFHWQLAFPEVFRLVGSGGQQKHEQSGWSGGFDVVLGNPPWERVNLKEQEWFSERRPEIATSSNSASRKRLIEALRSEDCNLFNQFEDALRQANGEGHAIRSCGLYPLCGRGDINLYAVFAERMRLIICATGRVGTVLPSGIATDDTTKFFFQDIVDKHSLISLFDFENKGLFQGVHNSYKFCLFTVGAAINPRASHAEFVFFAHTIADISDPEKRFVLTPKDIKKLNPNSRTCPIFRGSHDAQLTKAIYDRSMIFVTESTGEAGNPWNVEIGRMFHSSDDSALFCSEDGEGTTRLYEAKCYWQFDHRFATFVKGDYQDVSNSMRENPHFQVKVRYNIEDSRIPAKFQSRLALWHLSFRKIARSTDARTLVVSITPRSGLLDSGNNIYLKSAKNACLLLASLNSFVVDYVSRQKIGGPNMTVGVISQLPMFPPSRFLEESHPTGPTLPFNDWLLGRLLELTFTAWDLEEFAIESGWAGPPFRWNVERRFSLRAELDAAFFQLYLPADSNGNWISPEDDTSEDFSRLVSSFPSPRDAVSYIMDTFPIVRRKDEEKYNGDYRTKRVILEIYDAMQEAIRTGVPYKTRLDPSPGPPADPLPEWLPGAPRPANWPSHIHAPW